MNNYTKYFLVEHDKIDQGYFFIYGYVYGRGYTPLKWAFKKDRNLFYMDLHNFKIENIEEYITGDWNLIYEDQEEFYRTWHDAIPSSNELIKEISEETVFDILL